MKNIIINGRFLTQRITGVQRYAREIILELDKLISKNELEIVVPPETKEIPIYKNIKVVKIGKLHNQFWEHISFPIYVKKKKGISVNLCNVAPIISPDVVCIHDVKIKVRPKDFTKIFLIWYRFLFMNSTKRAKKIITVSAFSKREIIKYYRVKPENISVIPNAWQHYERIEYDEKALEKYQLQKGKFFFAISSLEPNKNFKWISEAARKNPKQIFAVAGVLNRKVFSKKTDFNFPHNMKLLGYVSDKEVKTLMRDCKAFLFPTFYEGFGIPPLEAMSAGCKNIFVSDTEIMHEIFEDKVNYIFPEIFNNNIDFSMQKENSYEDILQKYSWEKSAKLLLHLINIIRR